MQGENEKDNLKTITIEEYRRLISERDEADRRAGAAERKNAHYLESIQARDQWLRKAKEEWGVHEHTSFDQVWKEALQMKRGLAKLKSNVLDKLIANSNL